MNGIQINKLFKKILSNDEQILEKVKKANVQPMVLAPTEFPFISFMHGTVTPDYAKDCRVVDALEESVAVVSDNYEDAVDIAQRVREIFEFQQYEDSEIYIPLFEITSITEDQISNSFLVEIVFKFEIQSKV